MRRVGRLARPRSGRIARRRAGAVPPGRPRDGAAASARAARGPGDDHPVVRAGRAHGNARDAGHPRSHELGRSRRAADGHAVSRGRSPKPKTKSHAKSKPSPEGQTKHRSKREKGTGPDDSNPSAPPSSLLNAPAAPSAGTGAGGAVGSFVLPAPKTRGVPNILLDGFRVPPFLLPIYQAAGVAVRRALGGPRGDQQIETDYGRNLNVCSAGALGWMQFMPATWEIYGVDANSDGATDPYNPVDAIFAAARYLGRRRRHGPAPAIFAYNHADWYVNDVLRRASASARCPPRSSARCPA